VLPEKLKAISIKLNGTPGVRFNKVSEVLLKLLGFQFVRAAIKIITDPANCPGISVNGFWGFALKFESSLVALIKFLKSFFFCWFHGIYSF
jgi:hypothetical protein